MRIISRDYGLPRYLGIIRSMAAQELAVRCSLVIGSICLFVFVPGLLSDSDLVI